MKFLQDTRTGKYQYSKVITFLCVIIMILSIIIGVVGYCVFALSETISIAIVTAGAGLGATAVVFNLKKSQAENTITLYLSAYKEIIQMNKENSEEIKEELKNKIMNKMEITFDTAIDDAVSPIEKQDII